MGAHNADITLINVTDLFVTDIGKGGGGLSEGQVRAGHGQSEAASCGETVARREEIRCMD